jgi:hypothetical protein
MSEEIENEAPVEEKNIEEKPVEETINPIDEAKNVLEETKKTLASISEERKRIEKATAEMLVNGRSYAGQAPPKEETADEKWAREAKLRYAGTGMDPTI